MRGSHLQSHVTFWLHGHVSFWLYGHVTNSKNLYLLFRNTYGHQTWQSSNLQWANTTFKVTWPFYYVITWQIQKTYICSSTIPMATKLLQNHVNFWWRGHMTIGKNLYLHLQNTYGHQTYIREVPSTILCNLLISWSREKWKTL